MPIDGPFASARVPEDLDELRRRELAAIGKVAVRRDLAKPHPGLSKILAKDEKRRQKYAESGWAWRSSEARCAACKTPATDPRQHP